jgi:Domain of unknown function (DUF397)
MIQCPEVPDAEPRRCAMNETVLPVAGWRKSSFSSTAEKNCAEATVLLSGAVALRDSKNPAGPVLVFTREEWTAFILGVRAGEFELNR